MLQTYDVKHFNMAKTWLKVIKDNVSESDHLAMSGQSCWALSLKLCFNCCVQVSPFLSSSDANDDHQWEVQALSAGLRVGARCRCKVIKEGFHL
jgi:hypothetical protein